jgi:hypothetical protein
MMAFFPLEASEDVSHVALLQPLILASFSCCYFSFGYGGMVWSLGEGRLNRKARETRPEQRAKWSGLWRGERLDSEMRLVVDRELHPERF